MTAPRGAVPPAPATDATRRAVRVVAGIGCSRDCPPDELRALVETTVAAAGGALAALATIDCRADEPCMLAAAEQLDVPLLTYSAEQLAAIPVPTPSDAVLRHVGTPSVAEAAALLSGTHLLVTKQRTKHATCAVAAWPE